MTKTRGITTMTVAKHKYDGYAVRKERNSYRFRQYVSYSAHYFPERTSLNMRREIAFKKSQDLLAKLNEILSDKKSWKGKTLLSPAISKILKLDFKVEV